MAKKTTEPLNEEAEVLDGEVRVYELGFHLDPELPTEEVKKAYGAIRTMISEAGPIVAEGEPVSIPLAYTISRQETTGRRDFNSAHFAWIAYEATPEAHAKVVSSAGADTRIIRFIDLLTDKETARHAVEMREIAERIAEQPSQEDTTAAELDAALENVIA